MSLGLALGCMLGLAVLAYLLLPLVLEGGGRAQIVSAERSELEDLYIRREGMYSTLKELDFDFETGKLIEDDYRELRMRYSDEGVRILQRIDAIEGAEQAPRSGRRLKPVPAPKPGGDPSQSPSSSS